MILLAPILINPAPQQDIRRRGAASFYHFRRAAGFFLLLQKDQKTATKPCYMIIAYIIWLKPTSPTLFPAFSTAIVSS